MTKRGNHVAHLTSVHIPFDKRIFEKECRSLAAAGYRVSLVVPADKDVEVDGVHIRAIPRAKGRIERMRRTAYDVLRVALELDADLYHFHDPELIPTGLMLKARGKRVIYDVHENLPGDIKHSKPYLPRWIRPPLALAAHAMESIAGRAFDGIVTITKGFAERFPAEKTCVVSNYPIFDDDPTVGLPAHRDREPIAVFTGCFGVDRAAVEMLDGVELANARGPVRLTVAGSLNPTTLLADLATRPSMHVLDYLGETNRAGIDALLRRARIGLLMNPHRPDFQDISTNKLYEYMLFALPVVASPIASWRSDIERHQCGLVIDANTPEAIGDAVAWLIEHPDEAEAMGRRGAAAVHANYKWSTEAAKLVEFYDNLLADVPSPAVHERPRERDGA